MDVRTGLLPPPRTLWSRVGSFISVGIALPSEFVHCLSFLSSLRYLVVVQLVIEMHVSNWYQKSTLPCLIRLPSASYLHLYFIYPC